VHDEERRWKRKVLMRDRGSSQPLGFQSRDINVFKGMRWVADRK